MSHLNFKLISDASAFMTTVTPCQPCLTLPVIISGQKVCVLNHANKLPIDLINLFFLNYIDEGKFYLSRHKYNLYWYKRLIKVLPVVTFFLFILFPITLCYSKFILELGIFTCNHASIRHSARMDNKQYSKKQ